MKRLTITVLAFCLCTACVTGGSRGPGQAAIKDFETRTIDASFEEVYSASVEAMFDLGYTISHSDKDSGVVVGEKRKKRPMSELFWIADPKIRRQRQLYDTLQLTLLVRPKGKARSKVRIKTDINKQRRLNRQAINEVWVYIDRQVMMEADPTQASTR